LTGNERIIWEVLRIFVCYTTLLRTPQPGNACQICKGNRMNKFSGDIAHYRANDDVGRDLWLNPAVWAIACYRLSNWVNVAKPLWPVRAPLKLALFVVNKFFEVFMEMCISPQASIGAGFYIAHIGGVHISQYAVIGKNCDMGHRVTIGVSAMGRQGAPWLGDDVYVGTGATLIGKIRVGSGARIAANTLVIDDVPDGATVIGVPGRIMLGPAKTVPASPAAAGEEMDSSSELSEAVRAIQ
jgi:serine O-acetyltransferase